MASSWLKLYQHLQAKTDIKVVSSCAKYREMARDIPSCNDTVLEIGSSTGLATKLLAHNAKQVIAVDTSYSFIEKSRAQYAKLRNIQFVWLDAREIETVQHIVSQPNVIFMDIGGDTSLVNLTSMLRLYLINFSPRLFVVRNFELAILYNLITEVNIPQNERRIHALFEKRTDTYTQQLIDLSHSDLLSDRAFAARKLRTIKESVARQRLLEMANDASPKIRKICMH